MKVFIDIYGWTDEDKEEGVQTTASKVWREKNVAVVQRRALKGKT